MTQLQRLAQLFRDKPHGVSSMDIIKACGTTSPSKRLSELRDRGWTVTKLPAQGRARHHWFFAKPPRGGDPHLERNGKR